MRDTSTIQPSRWRSVIDFLVTFWPLILTPLVLFFSARFHHPWIGMAIFVAMAFARRWWWTCIFGLLNAAAILGGFIACVVIGIKMLTR